MEQIVEVIRGLTTSDDTYQQSMTFARSLGKEPITPDRPGLIVNRLVASLKSSGVRPYGTRRGKQEEGHRRMGT
jgi:3-hydroxyacyl-CoA dehydrogenase